MLRYMRSMRIAWHPFATALNRTCNTAVEKNTHRSLLHDAENVERFRLALVGRTNVGKSTLSNRMTRTRGAIVHNVPGTTRDRRISLARMAGLEFDVVDTGGLEDSPSGSLEEGMLSQTKKAIHEANMVFFLIDGREGVTAIDSHFARWMRRQDPKGSVHVLVNKVEGYPDRWQDAVDECFQLGFGQPIPISAEHGEGLALLLDVLIPAIDSHEKQMTLLNDIPSEDTDKRDCIIDESRIKLAIVGRPNVGKSTLLNRIIRDDRVLTGPEPGVTRDAVEVPWIFGIHKIKLVDTAGIRRQSKRDHSNQIEQLSVRDSYKAIDSAQVVALVVDLSNEKLTHMDLTIAKYIIDQGRGLLLIANKSDLIHSSTAYALKQLQQQLETSLAQVRGVPIVPVSALNGSNIRKIMPHIATIHEKYNYRISTGRLNRWFRAISRHHPPPTIKGKAINIKYMTQSNARPPTFVAFVSKPSLVPESYQRFLLAQLREEFDLNGIPARLILRASKQENPFQKRSNYQRRSSTVAFRYERKEKGKLKKK